MAFIPGWCHLCFEQLGPGSWCDSPIVSCLTLLLLNWQAFSRQRQDFRKYFILKNIVQKACSIFIHQLVSLYFADLTMWHSFNKIWFSFFFPAIFLGSLKLPHHEVKKLILNCDQTVLTESAINSLLKYLPSPEQVSHKRVLWWLAGKFAQKIP